MDDIVFAGNRALYLILVMSAGPIAVATFVGLLVGLFQTVTQLQEQTLPFGVKLLCVSICFFHTVGVNKKGAEGRIVPDAVAFCPQGPFQTGCKGSEAEGFASDPV